MIKSFKKLQAQTSKFPIGLEIIKAKGCYLFTKKGEKILDFTSGVSATGLGHGHKKVTKSIIKQTKKHLHVMVYGEFIQKEPLELCKKLDQLTPFKSASTYLTNSGTEAMEGAIKLSKRVTNRLEIISAFNSYHGNTQGSMSISGPEGQKQAFRPLIPGNKKIRFNSDEDLEKITTKTAAVVLETIQGGAGFILPQKNYLKKVKQKCQETGTLLILDEIQTGIGRLGTFFGFEKFGVKPDIIVCGKGLSNGLPIGAFIAEKKHMDLLSFSPKLGHITTYGGNPLVAASANATIDSIFKEKVLEKIQAKENLIRENLIHPKIMEIRGKGLMLAVILKAPEIAEIVFKKCLEKNLLLFFLLFEKRALRITPALNIRDKEIKKGCKIIIEVLDKIN